MLVGVLVDEEADDEDETEERSEPENILEGEEFQFGLWESAILVVRLCEGLEVVIGDS